MTDDIKDEMEGDAASSAEPDFSPSSPILADDTVDDDPHASFDAAVEPEVDAELDMYGVGAPGAGDDYEDDEDALVEENFNSDDSEAY